MVRTILLRRNPDTWYDVQNPLFRLRLLALRHRLTRRQRSIIRRNWIKNWLRFILWGPLY